MKFNITVLLFFLLLVFSVCEPDPSTPDLGESISFDYGAKIETKFRDGQVRTSYEYYDSNEQLIESVIYESRYKYIYDSSGKLVSVFRCRITNCEAGVTEIMVYDEDDNLLGSHTTSTNSSDTTIFNQTKFYNSDNQLTHEMTDNGIYYYTDQEYEKWSFYKYQKDLIKTEIQKINSDTSWIGSYYYNTDDLLKRIEYWKENIFRFITYEYDENGNIVSKALDAGPEELAGNVEFHVHENRREFEYDSLGRISVERLFNHKEELQWSKKYIYFKE